MNRERKVGRSVLGDALNNHVDHDVTAGDGGENPSGDARLIAHVVHRKLGLVTIQAHTADDHVFHVWRLLLRNCSLIGFKTRADLELHAEFFRKLDGARLHHLRASAGHLQQFIVSDLVQFFCIGHDSRVASENPVDVGKYLAGIGVERAGQRNRCQIRAATAECGRFAFGRLSLKPGHNDDVILSQKFLNLFRADVRDARFGVNPVS